MKLGANLPDGASVLIDTNPLIYVLEGNPLGTAFKSLFADVDAGRLSAVVTPITVAEVVSGPLKAGKDVLAERYRRAITDNTRWSVHTIDVDTAMLAARLRLRYKLKLPDAFQLAAALSAGCAALVTHDRDFASVSELPVLGA